MAYRPQSGLTMTIKYRVDIKDSIGANNPSWTTRLSGIACDRAPISSQMASDFGRPDLVGHYAFYTSQDVASNSNERIEVGGIEYPVEGYLNYTSPFSPTVVYVTLAKKRNQ